MKQVLQSLSNGETTLSNVPCPKAKEGRVLIQTSKSLLSVGTERMLVEFGNSNWIKKARSQPDKVKMVLEKVKTDGISASYEAVKSKLNQPLPLGYCNVGTVIDSADTGLETGKRVISNGHHAEVVRVPKNLVVPIPDNVDDETACFAVLGAIALQGVRLIKPTIGEVVVVVGLGVVGLLTVQILKANGCIVLGIDFDTKKCALAKQFGAEVVDLSKGEDPLTNANVISRGRGVDAVLITASAKKDDIVHQAATMCRKRGRIVLVGVVDLKLNRADFYTKELTFQVSCSYGPGRYDKEYEEKGLDYPFPFVRWTEQRNFEAVLDLMSSGAINVKPMISASFSINDVKKAYQNINDRSSLGIILDYENQKKSVSTETTIVLDDTRTITPSQGSFAFIGAGNYASRILIPAFKKAGAGLISIVTSGGVSAFYHGDKNGFAYASTDMDTVLNEQIDSVVISTQHNLHASQVVAAINKGKHVFVEKPLALNHDEIDSIEEAMRDSNSIVMVGYNRRFSPQIQKMKSLLAAKTAPKNFIFTMNAGEISTDHWVQNPSIGGGRIIGEACHYIDLMRYLADSKIKSFSTVKMGVNDYVTFTEDKATISLSFEDGSFGTIHYFANGGKSFPKERIEVFCNNATLQLDNFRRLKGYGWQGFKKMNLWKQDKGQVQCASAFVNTIKKGGANPIPHDEIFEVARASVDIAEQLRN